MLCLVLLAPGALAIPGGRDVNQIMADYDHDPTAQQQGSLKLKGLQMELRLVQEKFAADARRKDIAVARDAIDSIENLDDEMETKRAQVEGSVKDAKKQIARTIRTELELNHHWNKEVGDLKASMQKFNDWVSNFETKFAEKRSTLQADVAAAQDQTIFDLITESRDRAVRQYNTMPQKKKRSKEVWEQSLGMLKQQHAANLRTADAQIAGFDQNVQAARDILNEVPNTIQQKGGHVEQMFAEETAEREGQIREIEEEIKMANQDTMSFGKQMVEQSKTDFRDMQAKSDRVYRSAQTMGKEGMNQLEQDGLVLAGELRSKASTAEKKLKKRIAKLDRKLEQAQIKLFKAEKDAQVLPAEYKQQIELMRMHGDSAYAAVQEKVPLINKLSKDLFETTVNSTLQKAIRTSNLKKDTLIGKGDEAIAKSLKAVERPVRLVMRGFNRLLEKQKKMQEDMSQAHLDYSGMLNNLAEVRRHAREVNETTEKEIHAQDAPFKKDFREAKQKVKHAVGGYVDQIETATDSAEESMKIEESKVKQLFREKYDHTKVMMRTELHKITEEQNRLDHLAQQMTGPLKKKVEQVDSDLTKIETKHEPGIKTLFKEFMTSADKEIGEVDQEGQEAIGVTWQKVHEHLAGLDHVKNQALDALSSSVERADNSNKRKVSSAASDVSTHLTDAEVELGVKTTKATETLDAAKKQVLKNENLMHELTKPGHVEYKGQFMESIPSAFNGVEYEIGQQRNKLTARTTAATDRIDQVTGDAEQRITEGKEKLEAKGNTALGQVQGYIDQHYASAKESVKTDVTDLVKLVDQEVDDMTEKTAQVSSHDHTLRGALKELQSRRKLTKTVEASADAVSASVADEGDVLQQSGASLEESLQEVAKSTQKDINGAITTSEEQVSSHAHVAGKEALQSTRHADAESKEALALIDKASARLSADAVREARNTEHGAKKLMAEVAQNARSDALQIKALEERMKQLDKEGQLKSTVFAQEVSAAGAELAELIGSDHEELSALVEAAGAVDSTMAGTAEAQQATDKAVLEAILKEAKTGTANTKSRVEEARKNVATFGEDVQSAEDRATDALQRAENTAENFAVVAGDASRRLVAELGQEKAHQAVELEKLQGAANHSAHSVEPLVHLLNTLETKLSAQVRWQVGKLGLLENKVESDLSKSMQATRSVDEDSLNRTRSRIEAAVRKERILQAWKTKNEVDGDRFRELVNAEFAKLGEAVDLAELEAVEQQAMDGFAVQQARKHLEDVLGEELATLDETSKARLEALSRRTGAQIAQLMNDESITEKERADKLAALKEQARLAAEKILEDSGEIKLDQATAVRHIKVVTDEVASGAEKLASLTHAITPAAGLKLKLERTKQMIDEAQDKLLNEPDFYFLQGRVVDPRDGMMRYPDEIGSGGLKVAALDQQAAATPAGPSLLELDQQAAATAEAAAAEDRRLAAQAHELSQALS